MTLIELLNSAALLTLVAMGLRTESRLTRLETIMDYLLKKESK